MATVKLKNLQKTFDRVQVIKGVDLDIQDGEFTVFVGPSGCGKSTLLRLIAGLESVSAGTIEIGGDDVTHLTPSRRELAMVFQSYALFPHMSVAQNIGFGLKLAKVPTAEREERIRKVAQTLHLDQLLDRSPRQLSGGQRQRVAIGRAIIRNPRIFLFDEPLSNLDAQLRVDMRVEIARLHDEIGATMIYVTHDQVEAMTLANKIVVLRDGLIEQVGAPMDIYRDPCNVFVAGFIGSPKMNFLTGTVTDKGIKIDSLECQISPNIKNWPSPGNQIILGIRPQDITLSRGSSNLRVQYLEQLGGVTYHYLHSTTNERIVVETPEDFTLTQNDSVNLTLDMDKVYLFDAGTEQRIR